MKPRPADAESHHTAESHLYPNHTKTYRANIQPHETTVIVTIFILDVVSQSLSFY